MEPILEQSIWKYCGPEPGRYGNHKVIMHSKKEVVTVALNVSHSWLGSPDEFYASFRFVSEK